VLNEVIASINRTDGAAGGSAGTVPREDDVSRQIGPKPQWVIEQQLPRLRDLIRRPDPRSRSSILRQQRGDAGKN